VLPALWFRFIGFDVFPWSVVWWTLITEVQFYLALPLAGWLACRGPGGRWLLLALLLAWALAYALLVVAGGDDKGFLLTKSLFARLPAFLLGAAAAWLSLHSSRLARTPPWQRLAGTLLCLGLLALLLQAVVAVGDRAAEQGWHLHHTFEAALWAALLLLLLGGPFPGRALLVNRPMAWVGKLSYSIYLNHVPILFYLIYPAKAGVEHYAGSLAAWGWPLLGAALSLTLAAVTWRLVELPFLNLKGRLAR
jgi:peptidoglycan/LPS O-acetylase OafA/YrhL